MRIFFLSRSRASSFASAPSKEGGGGPCCCCCCCCCGCCCFCLEIGGRGISGFSCCCCCCCCCCSCCCCCCCCCCYCFPITGRALDIIFFTFGSPLAGRAPDIIIFFSPLVGRGINFDKSRGWGIPTFSLKFDWGIWRDSPFNSRLEFFRRAASLACPEVVFLIICGVTPVIWVKVPRRGAALPRAKLRNIIGPSLVFRAS